jgi:hypothetical protein
MCRLTVYSYVDQNLLILFFIIFTCDIVRAKESVEDEHGLENVVEFVNVVNVSQKKYGTNCLANLYVRLAQQTLDKINRSGSAKTLALLSSKIDKVDVLIKQKTLTILNSLASDFQSLTNRIVRVENKLAEVTGLIKEFPIINQIGLINTSAAHAALTTVLVVTDSGSEVAIYNADIVTALTAVKTAVMYPLQKNTIAARVALGVAITDFLIIISQDHSLSVISLYSFAEIYATLMQLDAQLAYLKKLQNL